MPDRKQRIIDFLSRKDVEDLKLNAYHDTANIITIGIGLARTYPNGSPIKIGDTCTKEEAYNWCGAHLSKSIYPTLDPMCDDYIISDDVYVALGSFAYNLGAGCLKGESIIAALESGDLNELATAFRKYNKSGGVIVNGLINRREKEIQLFLKEN